MDPVDSGLGLAEFIGGSASTEDASASSQESANTGEETTTDKATATGTEGAAAETEKKEDSQTESSPSDTETQVRQTVEEALKGDKKEAKETPEAGKDKTDDAGKKEEQAKTSNWDSDDNPYRHEVQRTQQQLQAARSWSNELNKANLNLQRNMERLEKKIDGTWTEADDKAAADQERAAGQQDAIFTEETAAMAELKGATVASLYMAYDQLGKEKVDTEIREFDQLFQRNPLIMSRVTGSKRPIQEALKVLNEFRTAKKYGTSDLGGLIAKVKEEAIAEATPALVEKITKEIMGKLDLRNKETQGIRGVRGNGRGSVADQVSGDTDEDESLSKLFPN